MPKRMTKEEILTRIEKLQQTRDYADEVESARLTQAIKGLQNEHDSMEQRVNTNPGRE